MFQSDEGKAVFAFVCFKSPEGALKAKELLNGSQFNGKSLYVNHYEIKEFRQ